MYLELEKGKGILSKENLFYEGDTSIIYREKELLYKIYLRQEPYIRQKLDILIANENLRDVGILPIKKIRTLDGSYGMVMRRIRESYTYLTYQRNNPSLDNLIKNMIILSDGLKRINNENIMFPDLHHNNILFDVKGKPWFIDFDDAVIGEYYSNHICCICRKMHEVETLGRDYEKKLMKYGNMDREALYILFLDYLLGINIEELNKNDYLNLVDYYSKYFPLEFIKSLIDLKKLDPNDISYQYYLGDYLKDERVVKGCKVLRRSINEHNSF